MKCRVEVYMEKVQACGGPKGGVAAFSLEGNDVVQWAKPETQVPGGLKRGTSSTRTKASL